MSSMGQLSIEEKKVQEMAELAKAFATETRNINSCAPVSKMPKFLLFQAARVYGLEKLNTTLARTGHFVPRSFRG